MTQTDAQALPYRRDATLEPDPEAAMTQTDAQALPSQAVSLQMTLRSRLLPVAALVAWLVSLSAPLAFLLLRQSGLQAQAGQVARQVADVIQLEVRLRPRLWRYDTIKIVHHLRQLRERREVVGIEIVDRAGTPIAMSGAHTVAFYREIPALWQEAPIQLNGRLVGAVWVAMALRPLRKQALLLFAFFLCLGLGLAACILFVPMRTMAVAEADIITLIRRLEQAQESLTGWNVILEQEVKERSLALQDAFVALQEKEQRLRVLSAKSMSLQAEERRHIARELHDSAGQALTAIHIHLQLVQQQLSLTHNAAATELVTQALAMSEQTLEEIRRAVMLLGPAVLDDFGLATALKQGCEDFQERTGIAVTYTQAAALLGLSKGIENACYRIVQEGLTNIARHASATSVSVEVCCDDACLYVVIADDGCGFSVSASSADTTRQRRGLRGMQERIELFAGSFAVESIEGKGTTLRVSIPLVFQDEHRDGAVDERGQSGVEEVR